MRASVVARSSVDQILEVASPVAGKAIGALIREARMARGLSQTDLGVALGIKNRKAAYRRVRSWETGEGKPSREYVLTIAKVLDVDLRDWAGAIAGDEPKGEGWAAFKAAHRELFESKADDDVAAVRFLRGLWLRDGVEPKRSWWETQLSLFRMAGQ